MYNSFAGRIEDDGTYDAMLYTGEYFFNTFFDKSLITDDIWIAKYATAEPSVGRLVQVWQYSSEEISTTYWNGKLDRNYMLTERFQGSTIKVENISSNPYPEPTKTLKLTLPRTKGNDVKWLQWELAEVGILGTSDVDGVFGPKTKEAVKQYQANNGLLVDGIVGSATRYALKNN